MFLCLFRRLCILVLAAAEHLEVKLLDTEGAGVGSLRLLGDDGVYLLHGGPGRGVAEHGVMLDIRSDGHGTGGSGGAPG